MFDLRCCDNLELMKVIQDNTVDLIYCDILYGTGRKFADYQDLKPIRSEIEAHYLPRLIEMKRILKDTGSIYLQMDTRINHWVRCLMDDIFGYNNFRNEIIWKYNKFSTNKKTFAQNKDNIILYSKTKDYVYKEQRIPVDKIRKQTSRVWDSTLKKAVQAKDENGNLLYYTQQDKAVDNVWLDLANINPMAKERLDYDTQKPKALIERIIKASSNEGDLVADFYAGSFTTAEVCKDLNRNFIGCDINPRAVEIGLNRLKGE